MKTRSGNEMDMPTGDGMLPDSAESLADTAINVADRLAIINVLNSYGFFIDQHKVESFFSLFTDAPTIEIWNRERVLSKSWDEFREAVTKRQELFRREGVQRRHVLTAPRFERQDDDMATGQVYLLQYKTQDGVTTLVTSGYYEFTMIRHGRNWKIQRWVAHADATVDAPKERK